MPAGPAFRRCSSDSFACDTIPPTPPGGSLGGRCMNGNGEFNPQAEDYGYLRGDFVTGFETYGPGEFRPDISMGFTANISRSVREAISRAFPSAMDSPAAIPEAVEVLDEVGGSDVMVPAVIDPDTGQTTTVFEGVPDGIYETNRAETDWDRVYREYVILNPPVATYYPGDNPDPMPGDIPAGPVQHGGTVLGDFIPLPTVDLPPTIDPEVDEVAVDWGSIAGQIVGGVFDPFGAGAATTSFFNQSNLVAAAPGGGNVAAPPARVTVDTRTGAVTVCRRRRRRRLLTSSDLADIAALKAIIGGGAALNSAVVKAVRR